MSSVIKWKTKTQKKYEVQLVITRKIAINMKDKLNNFHKQYSFGIFISKAAVLISTHMTSISNSYLLSGHKYLKKTMHKEAGMAGLGGFTLHQVPSCHLKCFHFWFLSGFDYSTVIFFYKFQRLSHQTCLEMSVI